jgi:hypothetical protein
LGFVGIDYHGDRYAKQNFCDYYPTNGTRHTTILVDKLITIKGSGFGLAFFIAHDKSIAEVKTSVPKSLKLKPQFQVGLRNPGFNLGHLDFIKFCWCIIQMKTYSSPFNLFRN